MAWQDGNPPTHGYYLAAWWRGDYITVSELWYNPDSTGGHWWSGRGYMQEHSTMRRPIETVFAWQPKPEPPAGAKKP